VHTAVKINPHYQAGQAVYVVDASRAVGVVSSLLSPEGKDATIAALRAEYEHVAEAHAKAEWDKKRLPLADARVNAPKTDWAGYTPPKPVFAGTRVFSSYDVAELVPISTGHRFSRHGT
jgi:5-methyltetrahydrofolate--homocysteine methyltransferase